MKKVLMIAAMMVAAMTVKAQHAPGTFTIQPKAGIGVAWVSNSERLYVPGTAGLPAFNLDKSVTFAALIGAEGEYQIIDWFSVAAGLNYSLQGTGWADKSTTVSGTDVDVKDTRLQLGYINIPIVANFYVYKGLALKTGVQVGFLTNANLKSTIKTKTGGINYNLDVDESVKDECKSVDVSIPVGVSYEFSNVVIDARYNIGLTKVFKGDGAPDMKNQVFMITGGYKFEL